MNNRVHTNREENTMKEERIYEAIGDCGKQGCFIPAETVKVQQLITFGRMKTERDKVLDFVFGDGRKIRN